MAVTPVRPGTCIALDWLFVLPWPSCPSPPTPHAQTVPSDLSASVWKTPDEMATIPVSGPDAVTTCTGEVRYASGMPAPRMDPWLAPQLQTVPSCFSATVKLSPAVIAMTSTRPPVTFTGELRVVVVPSPNWPEVFVPQVATVPSARKATTCLAPAATDPTIS